MRVKVWNATVRSLNTKKSLRQLSHRTPGEWTKIVDYVIDDSDHVSSAWVCNIGLLKSCLYIYIYNIFCFPSLSHTPFSWRWGYFEVANLTLMALGSSAPEILLSPFAQLRGAMLMDVDGCTLRETNSLHLKIDGWKMSFLLKWPMFRGELLVSGSVTCLGICFHFLSWFFPRVCIRLHEVLP